MKSRDKFAEAAFPLLAVGIVVGLWESGSQSGLVPPFILPPPSAVFKESIEQWRLISVHALPTSVAVILGFIVAFAFSATAAVLAFSFRVVRLMLEPLLIVSQIIPKVAVAPVLLVAFGNGMATRILVAAIISFFPFYSNIGQGLGAVNDELILQAKLVGKTRTEILFMRCVYAIPFVMSASRSAILLSAIGVVVAEFLGANEGLGFLILDSGARFNGRLMFAAIFSMSIISAVFYAVVTITGRKLMQASRLDKGAGTQAQYGA